MKQKLEDYRIWRHWKHPWIRFYVPANLIVLVPTLDSQWAQRLSVGGDPNWIVEEVPVRFAGVTTSNPEDLTPEQALALSPDSGMFPADGFIRCYEGPLEEEE